MLFDNLSVVFVFSRCSLLRSFFVSKLSHVLIFNTFFLLSAQNFWPLLWRKWAFAAITIPGMERFKKDQTIQSEKINIQYMYRMGSRCHFRQYSFFSFYLKAKFLSFVFGSLAFKFRN